MIKMLKIALPFLAIGVAYKVMQRKNIEINLPENLGVTIYDIFQEEQKKHQEK